MGLTNRRHVTSAVYYEQTPTRIELIIIIDLEERIN